MRCTILSFNMMKMNLYIGKHLSGSRSGKPLLTLHYLFRKEYRVQFILLSRLLKLISLKLFRMSMRRGSNMLKSTPKLRSIKMRPLTPSIMLINLNLSSGLKYVILILFTSVQHVKNSICRTKKKLRFHHFTLV